MRIEDCFFLGSITRKHGTSGDVVVYMDTDQPQAYTQLESVLVKSDGGLVPFFIEKITPLKEQQYRFTFEEIQSISEAEEWIGAELYLPLTLLPALDGKKFYYHEVLGFEVEDAIEGTIGTIDEVLDRPSQPLIALSSPEGEEILIPAIDDFIQKIDREQKKLYIQVPEGLIDLYRKA